MIMPINPLIDSLHPDGCGGEVSRSVIKLRYQDPDLQLPEIELELAHKSIQITQLTGLLRDVYGQPHDYEVIIDLFDLRPHRDIKVVQIETPRNFWNTLKAQLFPAWLVRLFPVKYELTRLELTLYGRNIVKVVQDSNFKARILD